MQVRCPSCQTGRSLTAFLWQAVSPLGFRCADCRRTLRFERPERVAATGILFGLLLAAGFGLLFGLLVPQELRHDVGLRIAAVLVLSGCAMFLAHRLVLPHTTLRAEPEEARERRFPWAHLVAFAVSMVFALGLFALTMRWLESSPL